MASCSQNPMIAHMVYSARLIRKRQVSVKSIGCCRRRLNICIREVGSLAERGRSAEITRREPLSVFGLGNGSCHRDEPHSVHSYLDCHRSEAQFKGTIKGAARCRKRGAQSFRGVLVPANLGLDELGVLQCIHVDPPHDKERSTSTHFDLQSFHS